MFIGHFGVGLAGKKPGSKLSLGLLFLAVQWLDLLWPLLLLLGIEKVEIQEGNTAFTPLNFTHYPISHSLVAVLIWSLLFGVVYYVLKKDVKTAVVLGLLVSSHWVLDFVTHRPDLPLISSDGVKYGLGLWNSVAGTIIVEGAIFVLGIWLYIKTTKPKNRKGSIAFWSLIAFLSLIYVMNIVGPPPPEVEPIAYVGLSQWLIVLWGYWIDKNRTVV